MWHRQSGRADSQAFSHFAVAIGAQWSNVAPLITQSVVGSVNLRGEPVVAAVRAGTGICNSVRDCPSPSVGRWLRGFVVVPTKAMRYRPTDGDEIGRAQ